jgi:hypothetical protein
VQDNNTQDNMTDAPNDFDDLDDDDFGGGADAVVDEAGMTDVEYDAYVISLQERFNDPEFRRRQREREKQGGLALPTYKRTSAAGSVGNALALGFANVFDPNRAKEDVVQVQEKGEPDPDLPETDIDSDDPKLTRVIFHRRSDTDEDEPA